MMLLCVHLCVASNGARGYIVGLSSPPIIEYRGGLPNYPSTRPSRGVRLDRSKPDVVQYREYLDKREKDLIKALGINLTSKTKPYGYRYAYYGFYARLTVKQAAKLARSPSVVSVVRDGYRHPSTDNTPTMLGLTAQGGLWDDVGGVKVAGEPTIIGIIDTGIWPEAESFSDQLGPPYAPLAKWRGRCVSGEAFNASTACNSKLIGARFFNKGLGGDSGVKAVFPQEFNSPRDLYGHGTHTSSTAAGQQGVRAGLNGYQIARISGIAPRARVAMYKACWGPSTGSICRDSDLVQAVDQAVADGVDIINYSIAPEIGFSPINRAFLAAARAGIVVSAAASNSGPVTDTPWAIVTASGSTNRTFISTITLGNGAVYSGASLSGAWGPQTPLIDAAVIPAAGYGSASSTLCLTNSLNASAAAGRVVICKRGTNTRVAKSLAVKLAGGAGMVMANTVAGQSLNLDVCYVPTIHVTNADGNAILAYANAGPGATALLTPTSPATIVGWTVDPGAAKGPAPTWGGNLLKPDITAPGVNVLASISPYFVTLANPGPNVQLLTGTSMAAPHIAGLSALLRQAYPLWSPAAIKSALMTTTSMLRTDGTAIPGTPYWFGSGAVQPNNAFTPGLVYDAGYADWVKFLCYYPLSTGLQSSDCPDGALSAPYNLNYPSVSVGSLTGPTMVTRAVTNVETLDECQARGGLPDCLSTYTATITPPPTYTAVVDPSTITLARNATTSFTITLTPTAATVLNTYYFGSFEWQDPAGHVVYSPIIARWQVLSVPSIAFVSTAAPSTTYGVGFGYNGGFAPVVYGPVAPTIYPGTVNSSEGLPSQNPNSGTVKMDIPLPEGTALAMFSLDAADFSYPGDVFYLYVNSLTNTSLTGSNLWGSSTPTVVLQPFAATTVRVFIYGASLQGPTSTFKLYAWIVSATETGVLSLIAPSAAVQGTTGAVTLGVAVEQPVGMRYVGMVGYPGTPNSSPYTVVQYTA